MKKIAVIVAGGNGSRMNNPTPKQFLLLNNRPILYYSVNTFLRSYTDMQLILVLPEEFITAGQEIIDTFSDSSRIRITTGGNTRFHSVKNGLKLVKDESIVFVHDAVRCLLSANLIHRCYDTALEHGSAIPVVDCKDSVRYVSEQGNDSLQRNRVKLVQTPQTFQSKILLPAYQVDYNDKFTDEASVLEAFGLKVTLVEGEENNFKITRPLDLLLAESLVK